MSLVLNIPDDILTVFMKPKEEIEKELLIELALSLYREKRISMGLARKIAGLTKWEFIEELAKRKIERHYGQEELEEDLAYAKSSV